MICHIFKLNKYLEETKKYYHFFEGLFNFNKLPKKKTIEVLGINYSAYRVEKTRDIVKNDNINKLLNFFEINNVNKEDVEKYEILFLQIYYCCYYGNENSYDYYLEKIDILMEEKNVFLPILVLFKVFLYSNKFYDFDICKLALENDLNFLYAFCETEYFTDELKYLYQIMMFYFDKFDYENDELMLEVKKFSYKEPKLAWVYYSMRAKKAYINHNDKGAIMYLEILIKEYKNKDNMNKYLSAINNLAYSYNLEFEYVASLSYTENVIEYLFSSTELSRWIKFILVHYLFSKIMLKEYDKIVSFLDSVSFKGEYLTDVSAVICLVCAQKMKNVYFYNKVIKMCKDKEFYYYNSFAKYIETKDEKWLKFDKKPPYINRLILFLIS